MFGFVFGFRFVCGFGFRFGFWIGFGFGVGVGGFKEATRSGFEFPGFESDAFPCFSEKGRKTGHGILDALRMERRIGHGLDIRTNTPKPGIRTTLHAEFFGEHRWMPCLVPK